jgi:hypothetical protein
MSHWTHRDEDEYAPRGLPGPLPDGEKLLWQGSPPVRPFLKRIFHTHAVVCYVGILLGWSLVSGIESGDIAGAAVAILRFAGLAGGALGILAGVSWALARSTTYSITTRRVVIEFGAAFEKTLQIPFTKIASASVATQHDGTGDIVLTLMADTKIAYLLLWPNARPWHFSKPEPALRAIPDCAAVAQILSRALAASAGLPPVALVDHAAVERPASVAAAA